MQSTADDGSGSPEQLDEFDELQTGEVEELDESEPQGGEREDGEADETEEEGGSESAAPVRTERRPGRREREAAKIAALTERLERQERELASIRSHPQRQPQADPAEVARREQAEREQVAVLPLDHQIAYWRDKDRRENQQNLVNLQAQMADSTDRMAWEAKAANDPVRKRFSDRIEQALQAERAQGRNFSRDILFYALYGHEVDQQRAKQGNKQREAAQRRVRAQTTQPGGARSDVTRQRAPADDSIEAAYQRVFGSGRPIW